MINNHRAATLPKKPHPELKVLDRLVGEWQEAGGYNGRSKYEWMEGGFFLIHTFDGETPNGRHVKGVEFIGFDEDEKCLIGHLMDNNGCSFRYTCEIIGNVFTNWFGDKTSKNFYQGEFSKDGKTLKGAWQWPDGRGGTDGFEVTAKKKNDGDQ